MITMADQDDLDMAIATCKSNARQEGADTGKMEVSIFLLVFSQISSISWPLNQITPSRVQFSSNHAHTSSFQLFLYDIISESDWTNY